MNLPNSAEPTNLLVSVVIPVYNRGVQIQSTIDSVLAQTFTNIEVIVVDDGSTDASGDWIEAHYGNKVHLIRQSNQGVAAARNRGLEQACGEYIAFLDHDDIWLPQKLEKQIDVLKLRDEVGVVYCLWEHVDDNGKPLAEQDKRRLSPAYGFKEGKVFNTLIRENFIISMSVPLVRKKLFDSVGEFDSKMVPCDDRDMWLRLSQVTEFALVKEKLVLYFHYEGQQSGNEIEMWDAGLRIIRKHWKSLLNQPKILWVGFGGIYYMRTVRPYYLQVRDAINRGDWREAKKQIVTCFFRFPFLLFTPQWLYILKRLLTKNATPF